KNTILLLSSWTYQKIKIFSTSLWRPELETLIDNGKCNKILVTNAYMHCSTQHIFYRYALSHYEEPIKYYLIISVLA
ncbi:hypothetical protein, partial [Enterococcus faecalis]|uniref:hypothetical protein n=1 Tax=Enterococcus faecalis TaxID=1351 RepID=UPI001B313FA5